jgi:hypothetical protein
LVKDNLRLFIEQINKESNLNIRRDHSEHGRVTRRVELSKIGERA